MALVVILALRPGEVGRDPGSISGVTLEGAPAPSTGDAAAPPTAEETDSPVPPAGVADAPTKPAEPEERDAASRAPQGRSSGSEPDGGEPKAAAQAGPARALSGSGGGKPAVSIANGARVTTRLSDAEWQEIQERTGLSIEPRSEFIRNPVPVRVDFTPLAAAREREVFQVQLDLGLDEAVVLEVDAVFEHAENAYTLSGNLADDPMSEFSLSVYEDAAVGTFKSAAIGIRQLRYAGEGIHRVEEIDPGLARERCRPLLPPEEEPGQESSAATANPNRDIDGEGIAEAESQADAEGEADGMADDSGGGSSSGDAPAPGDNVNLDVFVAYTQATIDYEGGLNPLLALINQGVSETNLAFAANGIGATLRLVGTAEVAYSGTSSGDMLSALRSTNDGIMDEIHALRDSAGADFVSLWAPLSDAGGRGYLMTALTTDFAANAFNVVHSAYIYANTFAHELGHNFGCHHAVGDGNPPLERGGTILYPYSYGWRFTGSNGSTYRTIMAYAPGTRIRKWSDPNLLHEGTPTGRADTEDNARSIGNALSTLVQFRPESNDDHGNSLTTATSVPLNSITPGNLEEASDHDWFRVTLDIHTELTVETTGATDTAAILRDDNGASIASDSGSGEGANFLIVEDLAPGTYYVDVHGEGGTTGPYSFHVDGLPGDDHGNSITTATPISAPSTTAPDANHLEVGGDEDFFRIELSYPGTLVLQSTGSTDTWGQLQDDAGMPLEADDDSGDGLNFYLSLVLGPGTHYLRVRGFDGTVTGPYGLDIDFTPDVDPPPPPGNLTATDDSYYHVLLQWDSSATAETYSVYRHTVDNSSSATLLASGLTGLEYVDASAIPGQLYYYWVTASISIVESEFSNSASGLRFQPELIITSQPQDVGIEANDPASFSVSAVPNEGPLRYQWYFGQSGDTSQPMTWATGPTLSFSAVNNELAVWVRVFDDVSEAHSETAHVSLLLPPPGVVSAASGLSTSGIMVRWTAVEGASEYAVYRNTEDSSEGAVHLATVSGLSYEDTTAVAGQEYFYFVRAVNSRGFESSVAGGGGGSHRGMLADGPLDGTLLPLVGATDFAYSSDSERLYIAGEAGWLDEYSVSSRSITHSASLGRELGGIDVGPDGTRVFAAQWTATAGEGVVHRFDFAESEVASDSWTFSLRSGETGAFDVACVAEDLVLVSARAAVDSAKLRELDPTSGDLLARSGVPTGNGLVGGITYFAKNVSRPPGELSTESQWAVFQKSPASAGWFGYDEAGDSFLPERDHPNEQHFGAVNSGGTNYAVVDAGGTTVYFHDGTELASLDATGGVGFSPMAERLYAVDPGSDELKIYSTLNWQEVQSLPIEGGVDSNNGEIFGQGRLQVRPDGQEVAVTCREGIRFFDVGALLPAGLSPAPLGLSSTRTHLDHVLIRWGSSANAEAYSLYRSTTADPESAIQLASALTAPSYIDRTAVTGRRYFYWVTASNGIGESDFSTAAVGLRPFAPPQPDLTYRKQGRKGPFIGENVHTATTSGQRLKLRESRKASAIKFSLENEGDQVADFSLKAFKLPKRKFKVLYKRAGQGNVTAQLTAGAPSLSLAGGEKAAFIAKIRRSDSKAGGARFSRLIRAQGRSPDLLDVIGVKVKFR